MKVNLSEQSSFVQAVVLTELVRNKLSADYYIGYVPNITAIPGLVEGRLKQQYNNTLALVNRYSSSLSALSKTNEGRELTADAAAEAYRQMNRMLFFYEQAMKRILDRHKIPYSQHLVKLVVGKDLLGVSAWALGQEYHQLGIFVETLANLTNGPKEFPDGFEDDEMTRQRPTTLGHVHRAVCKLNKEILQKMGLHDIRFNTDGNDEIARAIRIAMTNMCQDFSDYETVHVLFEDEHSGCSWAEAHEIAVKRAEEYHQMEEARKRKEAHKAELKEAKKQNKEQTKK